MVGIVEQMSYVRLYLLRTFHCTAFGRFGSLRVESCTHYAVCVCLDVNETRRGAIMDESIFIMHNLQFFFPLSLCLSYAKLTYAEYPSVDLVLFFFTSDVSVCVWYHFCVYVALFQCVMVNYLWLIQPGLRCYHLYLLWCGPFGSQGIVPYTGWPLQANRWPCESLYIVYFRCFAVFPSKRTDERPNVLLIQIKLIIIYKLMTFSLIEIKINCGSSLLRNYRMSMQ
jgi:hypothetical protein